MRVFVFIFSSRETHKPEEISDILVLEGHLDDSIQIRRFGDVFRLEAGLEWRVAGLARRMDITPEAAAELVKTQSKRRAQFIRDYLGAEVGDWSYYDAVFNNERHGVEEIAAAVLAYVEQGWHGGGLRRNTP